MNPAFPSTWAAASLLAACRSGCTLFRPEMSRPCRVVQLSANYWDASSDAFWSRGLIAHMVRLPSVSACTQCISFSLPLVYTNISPHRLSGGAIPLQPG